MDPNIITKILAAGAMGVSIFCIFRVYDLLKKEQEKDDPRPVILKSIYIFMGFGIVMTLLSLGIEYARYNMNIGANLLPGYENYQKDSTDLAMALNDIMEKNYFSVNQNGNPEAVKLKYKNNAYVLSKTLSEGNFENNALSLKKAGPEKYLVIKNNNGKETIFGALSNAELNGILTTNTDNVLKDNELLALGAFYSPLNTLKIAHEESKENSHEANEYLIRLLTLKDSNKALQGIAIKLLTQPESLSILDAKQYETLINALTVKAVRPSPWDKYELAQVYLSRSWKSWNTADKKSDIKKYKTLLAEYVKAYDDQNWISENKAKVSSRI